MRLCVNWLPRSLDETRAVARSVEDGGLWGLGVGDSPRYGELYAACAEALRATTSIAVVTSVTNPVTRHPSVHLAAARAFGAYGPGRFRIGMGTGDSAVRDAGARPATRAELAATMRTVTAGAPDTPTLIAAGGPRTAAVAGETAGALIAGAGRDVTAIRALSHAADAAASHAAEVTASHAAEVTASHAADAAASHAAEVTPSHAADVAAGAAAASRRVPVWATVRLAIGEDAAEVAELRRAFLPRAISAARFNFGSGFDGKNVPEDMRAVLSKRFEDYDFAWHGRSGDNPTARLFADRPDVEAYLLRRFAIVGSPEECRAELTELGRHVDGVFTSMRFEDAVRQVGLLASLGLHAHGPEPAA